MLGREKISAIFTGMISKPQVHVVDVASEGSTAGKASVVATPETSQGSIFNDVKINSKTEKCQKVSKRS